MWRFLKKLEIELPYDPANPLLGIHTEETRSERDTCMPVFITALFIIARTRKQPRCPLADEWIRKLWYIYTMEYYSAIKFSFIVSLFWGERILPYSLSEIICLITVYFLKSSHPRLLPESKSLFCISVSLFLFGI